MTVYSLNRRVSKLEQQEFKGDAGAAVMIPNEGETSREFLKRVDDIITAGRQVLLVPRKGAAPCTIPQFLDEVTKGNTGLSGWIGRHQDGGGNEAG